MINLIYACDSLYAHLYINGLPKRRIAEVGQSKLWDPVRWCNLHSFDTTLKVAI
jgi:hypothetical protein